jgi:aryl-alcohol dehydrogenase-like predicted oxidoreductase
MEQRILGNSGISVGVIGFGAWQLNNPLWGGPDEQTSIRLVQAALASGCNFFDVAPGYGNGASESLLGQALQRRRQDAVICTKFGHGGPDGEDFSIAGLRASLEGSLRRLQTDYVDVLLLHNPPPDLLDKSKAAELYAELTDLQQAGKLRAFGASIDFAKHLRMLAETTDCQAAEVLFNALLQDTRQAFSSARDNGVGLIAKVPLDSGWLSGKYDAQSSFEGIRDRWSKEDIARRAALVDRLRELLPHGVPLAQAALRFILAHAEITTAIPGVKSMDQLEANLAAAAEPLPPESVAAIHDLWDSEIAADPLPW